MLLTSSHTFNTSLGSMSSTVFSSSNFQIIFDAALADYLEQTGVDLTKDSSAEKLQSCQSADAILELLQDRAKQFKDYRNGNHKLINSLKPVVQVLHGFSGVLGGVAGLVSPSSFSNSSLFYAPAPRCRSNQQT
jgi:hypothetical protein